LALNNKRHAAVRLPDKRSLTYLNKKWFLPAVLVIVVVLMACGCDKPPESLPVDLFEAPFLMTAEFEIDELEGALSFRKNSVDDYELVFLSPDTIAGMTIGLKGDIVTLSHMGIEEQTDLSALSPNSPMTAMRNILIGTGADNITATEAENGDITLTLEDGTEIIVYAGIPKRIEVPAALLTLKITGFERQAG
jgi:hypothetical protein